MIGKTISHYKITEELGVGGMGVVYRAEDQKLDRVVALKFLAPEFVGDSESKTRFVHEAKAASALDHPNICTIHDIEETDEGRLFLAMACYQGETVKELIGRGPLEPGEAVGIAVQVGKGLAKAHSLGIVHRDIKPANLFLTEDGLVKLLDFGIAKLAGQTQVTRTGALLGTMHYMSPEQLQAAEVDRRTDLWSLGVVLYEMLTGKRPFSGDQQAAVMYAILNTDPEPLSQDIPAELGLAVIRCLEKEPADRYQGVEELLLHLPQAVPASVTQTILDRTAGLREVADAHNVQPYPGLSSFSEKEAEYFHGRESKVESVWHKLRRERLLGIAGPSGVGKTSFLRAGLIPAKPRSWGVILATPGGSPLLSLCDALVPVLAGDTEAVRALLRERDLDATVTWIRRWRQRHDEALLVLDQFEELFTLSPSEEQARFADLLSRLTYEADVHVLVSLRDDFLFQCHEHAGLAPVIDALTLLRPLTGPTLRRALVQPALDCGYTFEDETFADEMIAEVEGERGALPLLAFAMARLWENRDRDRGLLTRQAYQQIGAVGGALAQHAETVMDQVGTERHRIVRELSRNLVTSQGTRAVRDRHQLLSVFNEDDRPAAEQILGQLIDARLLTSYEVKDEDGETSRRIEIVHESLLSAWPRLVRWKTQDADSAQLRDQLRQAALLWEQKDKTDDLLWTGTAFQEFELWRERYPGGLSTSEESFATAMVHRATRRRRQRRFAYTSSIVALLAVLLVVGGFWRQARNEAAASEARRYQMLAEDALATDNTLALALSITSLENEDTPEARRLAQRALWQGPVRFVLPMPTGLTSTALSPNGKWLATASNDTVFLWPASGGPPQVLAGSEIPVPCKVTWLEFSAKGGHLSGFVEPLDPGDLESPVWSWLWTVPEGRLVHVWEHHLPPFRMKRFLRGDPPQVLMALEDKDNECWSWRRYRMGSDEPELLGHADASFEFGLFRSLNVDPTARYLIDHKNQELFLFQLDSLQEASPFLIGNHPGPIYTYHVDWERRRVASVDLAGKYRIWDLDDPGEPIIQLSKVMGKTPLPKFSPSGDRLVFGSTFEEGTFISLLDLTKPGVERQRIWPQAGISWWEHACTPNEEWLVGSSNEAPEVWFFPLNGPLPSTWQLYPDSLKSTAGRVLWPWNTLPGGKQIVLQREYTELWVCSPFSDNPDCRLLLRQPAALYGSKPDPMGRAVLACENVASHAWLIPLDEGEPRTLGGFAYAPQAVAFSLDGRLAAVAGWVLRDDRRGSLIRIWDLHSDEERVLDPGHDFMITDLWFLSGNRMLSASAGGLREWNLGTGQCIVIDDHAYEAGGRLDDAERFLVIGTPEGTVLWDLEERTKRSLPIAQDNFSFYDIASDASFVAVGRDNGDVLYHSLETGETHRLLGHEREAVLVRVMEGDQKIMSASFDGTVRVWDIPQGMPLHTRPLDELLTILRAQTNLRVVTDGEAEDSYRIVYDPFPGWETIPTW